MLSEERKMKIISLVEKDSIVQVQKLAETFDVSIFTIRRDLTDLEEKGLIKKTHGGAVRIEKSMWLPSIEDGQKEAVEEKRAIALKASEYIENGDTIFFMGSSITHHIIPYIIAMDLTVVTNSLDVGKTLCSYENIETIIIGGKLKNYKGNILGSKAVEEIQNYYFDKAFIPCGGIQYKSGVTTSTIDSADFTRTVINCSKESILIADYRKIGRKTFSKICDVILIKRLITDDKSDKNELELISKKGIIIDIVKVEE